MGSSSRGLREVEENEGWAIGVDGLFHNPGGKETLEHRTVRCQSGVGGGRAVGMRKWIGSGSGPGRLELQLWMAGPYRSGSRVEMETRRCVLGAAGGAPACPGKAIQLCGRCVLVKCWRYYAEANGCRR